MQTSHSFRLTHNILGESRIIRDKVHSKTADFVDTNSDGSVHEYYADFRAERGDEPCLSVPYAKLKEYADHTGDKVITSDQIDQLEVARLFAHRDYEKMENPRPVKSLIDAVAPLTSQENKKKADWAIDTESKSLVFFTNDPPSKPEPRSSYDFRCRNTVLGEAGIFHTKLYRGWTADMIDTDGDGQTTDRDAGFRTTRTTEPVLTVHLEKLREKGRREGKEVLLDSELKDLKVGDLELTRYARKFLGTQEIPGLISQVAPLATDQQLEKARWAVDLSRGTLLFFTEETPPPEQRPEPPAVSHLPRPKTPTPKPVASSKALETSSQLKTALASLAGVAGMVAGLAYSASIVGPLLGGAIEAVQGKQDFGDAVVDHFSAPVHWAAHLHDQVQ